MPTGELARVCVQGMAVAMIAGLGIRCALPAYEVDEGMGSDAGIGGSDANTGKDGPAGEGGRGDVGADAPTSSDGGTIPCADHLCNEKHEVCWKELRCVARMVEVPAPLQDGGKTKHEIDATEVTRDQYETWLATAPPTAGQANWCQWNTSFAADTTCMGDPSVCLGPACGNHPQVCVDWCDAYAYCASNGKRLCGKIGGGPNAIAAGGNDSTLDQWFNACSSGGVFNFPYGGNPKTSYSDGFGTGKCNGEKEVGGTTMAVGSSEYCQSSLVEYDSVFDLSGNVSEWEDSCKTYEGGADWCRGRGGAFNSQTSAALACESEGFTPSRNRVESSRGFRCCRD